GDLPDGAAAHPLGQRSLHERIDLTVEDVLRAGAFDTGPKVLDQLIWLEDVRPDLVPPADGGLARRLGHRRRFALLQLQFVKPGAEHFPRLGAVLVLGAVVLALDDDAGRNVGEADRRVGGVDVLAAGP